MNVEGDHDGVLEKRNIAPAIPAGYAEHAPPPDLAFHVVCIWTRLLSGSSSDVQNVHRVLPDGCVDIVLGFGEPGTRGASSLSVTSAMGVGTMTRPLVLSGPTPNFYIGVRFQPGHALGALGVPASELTDDQIGYATLSSNGEAELDDISRQETNEARVDAVVNLVRRRVRGAPGVPLSVRAAVRRISLAQGNLRVVSLADEIGITRQQLARQFATHVGIAPKTFARVMRAQAALARADAARAAYPRGIDWSAIACDLGYYDQPHFIDDFKALTGLTPSKWIG